MYHNLDFQIRNAKISYNALKIARSFITKTLHIFLSIGN